MKLLLDENLPHGLRALLPAHAVFTVAYMKWGGVRNGALLARAGEAGFDALVTIDGGIEYQQNLANLPCSVIVLQSVSNAMEHVRPLLPQLEAALAALQPRTLVKVV